MQRFVLYRRVSTRSQGESGLGLAAQDRDMRVFLASFADEDHEVLGSFTDVASGGRADRPELAKAMDLARRTDSVLLVSKLDRLSRDMEFIARLVNDERLTFRVAEVPNADKAMIYMRALMSEMERDFIRARTRAALAEAKARGRVLGGLRPGTARRNAAAKILADVCAQRIEGIVMPMRRSGATLQAIADALTTAQVETPRGGQWSRTAVRNAIMRLEARPAGCKEFYSL